MGAAKGGNYTNKTNFVGTNYNDMIGGTGGNDLLAGGNGDDTINGGLGNDTLWGDSFSNSDANDNGQDRLYGDAGNDKIHGGNGKDYLNGGADEDELYGENGIDVMDGGLGNDRIEGGRAGDYNHGGAGDDRFVFTTNTLTNVSDSVYVQGAAGATVNTVTATTVWDKSWDVIDDFDAAGGNDVIDLSQIASFIGHSLTWRIANGTDATAGQAIGARAYGVWADASQTFIYADITGDGAADMKIQVSNVGNDDFIGVTIDSLLNVAVTIDDDELCLDDMTAEVRIAFGEPVLNFSEADLDVVGGTLSGGYWDGNTYVVTFTAANDFDGEGSVGLKAGNDVIDWSGNSPTGTLLATIDIDTKPPVITSLEIEDGSDATINIAENAADDGMGHVGVAVRVEFDDVVHLMDASKISVTTGATLGTFILDLDGMGGTFYLTVQDTSLTSVTVDIAAGAFGDDCDNPTQAISANAAVDLVGPTVASIVFTSSQLCVDDDDTTVTITFSEDVTGFEETDITVAGGTLSNFTMVNAHQWTATFTATANFDSNDAVDDDAVAGVPDASGISIAADSYSDGAGNLGAAGGQSVDVDTKAPTVTITLPDAGLDGVYNIAEYGAGLTVTLDFSEAVSLQDATAITLPSGMSLDGLAEVAGSNGTQFTATLHATGDGSGNLVIGEGAFTDGFTTDCNDSVENSAAIALDLTAPTVEIAYAVDPDELCGDTTSTGVTITFSEDVVGFTDGDLTVAGGSLSNFVKVNDHQWTATFTASANYDSDDGIDVDGGGLSIAAGAYTDAAGNSGGAGSANLDIDTLAPTASVVLAIGAASLLTDASPSTTLTVTPSEPVLGLGTEDFTFDHGTVDSVVDNLDGTYTVTVTATDGYAGPASVTLNAGGYTDECGNLGEAAAAVPLTIDRSNPTVVLNIVDTDLSDADNASVVTLTFSEAVQGLSLGDFTVVGGVLSNLSGSGANWTATFTATDDYDSNDGPPDGGSVTLGAGSYTDLNGNSGGSGSDTVNIDTKNPTVTSLTVSPTNFTDSTFTGTVTVVFSEAIAAASLALTDFTAAHGTFSNLQMVNATTWTLTFTATDGYDGADTIGLTNASYTDLIGNTGSGGSVGVTIDRYEPPVATVDHIAFVPSGNYNHNGDGTGVLGQFIAYDAMGNVIAGLNWATTVSSSLVVLANGTLQATSPLNNTEFLFNLFGTDVHLDAGTGGPNALGNDYVGGSSDLQIVIAYGNSDSLTGGTLGDTLWGGNGDDTLIGSAGNDVLIGGAGKDSLSGGSGDDRFVFSDGDSGTTVALRDVISDFVDLEDVIDLTALGLTSLSTSSLAANGAFVSQSGGNTFLTADSSGDGVADFSIMLTGIHALDTSNVLL